ncbi:MAG: Copper homeostasis protein cutC [Gemmatimonadetes bacterium]|nr:Copper homeostasis protein cutC [Gemmatimonadota bacterium]
MTVLIEACVDSVESALAAERGGAHRLELCDNLAVGGTTPSAALVAEVQERVGLPIMAMVRPRGGSFVHTAAELDQMRLDLERLKTQGVEGLVIGILAADSQIDAERMREFVRLAGETPVTFHKAFDRVPDQSAGLDTLMSAGVARVLTSGGAPTALAGVDALASLVARGRDRIHVLAGGKVRGENVREIVRASGVREVHARCEGDEAQIRAIAKALAPAS